jgi:serine protease AprX
MNKIIVIVLLLSFTVLFAQDKYMIYFKDKGSLSKETLSKSVNKDNLAKQYLSARSIERRKKSLGQNYFSFEDLPIEEKYVDILKNNGIRIANKMKWFNAVSAYLDKEQIKFLKSTIFVEKIERIRNIKISEPIEENSLIPHTIKKSSSTHNFDYGSSQTQNELSDISAVHDMGITGEGVIIGVLDTGFDWKTHIALNDRTVIAEKDFIYQDNETANDSKDSNSSQQNHGTSVFSILAGFDEGNLIGPAFNSEFILAKTEFVPTETHAEEDNYVAALEWMDSIGVDITTSSLGYSDFDADEFSYTYEDMDGKTTLVTKAAELAFDRGIVVITSAGNEGNTSWKYITAPGDALNTLTIGAVTSTNIVASYSSEGPTFDGRIKPEIVAMGSSITNALAGSIDRYGSGNGTSYSTPISAGIAGLLLSAQPHLNNKQVRAIMIESGDNVDNPDNERGYGLISALRAITYPNLETNGNTYTLHKIFDKDLNIDESSVELVFGDSTKYSMVKTGNVYLVDLPSLTIDETYEVYFSYKNSENTSLREPEDGNYKLQYGQLNIEHVLSEVIENPESYLLSQNYPNPFNPDTRINYSIPQSHNNVKVVIKVYNILGSEVRTLVDSKPGAGNHFVDFSSKGLSSGVYFYQLQAGEYTKTKKLIILK